MIARFFRRSAMMAALFLLPILFAGRAGVQTVTPDFGIHFVETVANGAFPFAGNKLSFWIDILTWVERFVHGYDTEHRHSALRFVPPDQRHQGLDVELLNHRHQVYQKARAKHPERWSGKTRNWQRTEGIYLHPQESDNHVTKHVRAYKSAG